MDHGPNEVTLEEFRRQMEWLTPGRKTTGLFFGVGFHEGFKASNQFVSEQFSKDSNCRGEFLVPPSMDPEEMRQEAKRLGFSGIKVYHTFITSKPSWHADV